MVYHITGRFEPDYMPFTLAISLLLYAVSGRDTKGYAKPMLAPGFTLTKRYRILMFVSILVAAVGAAVLMHGLGSDATAFHDYAAALFGLGIAGVVYVFVVGMKLFSANLRLHGELAVMCFTVCLSAAATTSLPGERHLFAGLALLSLAYLASLGLLHYHRRRKAG